MLKYKEVYENFLRCIVLFNEDIINAKELIKLVAPFFVNGPDLFENFKKILGFDILNDEAIEFNQQKSLSSEVNSPYKFLSNCAQPRFEIFYREQMTGKSFMKFSNFH